MFEKSYHKMQLEVKQKYQKKDIYFTKKGNKLLMN